MQSFLDFLFLPVFSGASWMKGFRIGPSIFLHKLLKSCLQEFQSTAFRPLFPHSTLNPSTIYFYIVPVYSQYCIYKTYAFLFQYFTSIFVIKCSLFWSCCFYLLTRRCFDLPVVCSGFYLKKKKKGKNSTDF